MVFDPNLRCPIITIAPQRLAGLCPKIAVQAKGISPFQTYAQPYYPNNTSSPISIHTASGNGSGQCFSPMPGQQIYINQYAGGYSEKPPVNPVKVENNTTPNEIPMVALGSPIKPDTSIKWDELHSNSSLAHEMAKLAQNS